MYSRWRDLEPKESAKDMVGVVINGEAIQMDRLPGQERGLDGQGVW
jgi:hypothetical protein